MGATVEVERLTKSFGRQNIWRDVTLTLPPGEISALLGPSGTGKSVFLKTLIGLIKPERGFVHVDVRERSYFWVDTSAPGKRSRIRGILADLAAKSDSQASARGERSVGPFHVGTDVDAVVGSAPAPPSAAPVEEDEGDVAAP